MYFLSRALRAALTVWGVSTFAFLLLRLTPGDPAQAMLGDQASPAEIAALRSTLGLDRSIGVQYADFCRHVVDGSLGHSFRKPEQSVRAVISEALPNSAKLSAYALAIAWPIGLILAIAAALWPRSRVERGIDNASLLGLVAPSLCTAPLAILVFAVKLRWLPLPGDDEAGEALWVLPAVILAIPLASILTRQVGAAMHTIRDELYYQAARARGLSPLRVFMRYGLRNALLTIITLAALQLAALLTGVVVVEKIFERPGLGLLILEAFNTRDLPLIQGCVWFTGLVYAVVNFALEMVYGWADPRTREASADRGTS